MTTWPCLAQPDGCACRCHAIAAGRARTRRGPDKRQWTNAQLGTLRSLLANGEDAGAAAETLTRLYGYPRSRRAVIAKAVERGWFYRQGWYSENEVRLGLGVTCLRVRAWRESGTLPARRHIGAIRGTVSTWWHIEEADLLRFIDQHSGLLFNPQTVKRKDWRRRAEVAARVNQRRKAV